MDGEGTGSDLPEGEDEIDVGQPIEELQSLRQSPPPGFFSRLTSRILRRQSTTQILDFSLPVLMSTFLEFIRMVVDFFRSSLTNEGEK